MRVIPRVLKQVYNRPMKTEPDNYKILSPKEKAIKDIYDDALEVFLLALTTARRRIMLGDPAAIKKELKRAEKTLLAAIKEAREKLALVEGE